MMARWLEIKFWYFYAKGLSLQVKVRVCTKIPVTRSSRVEAGELGPIVTNFSKFCSRAH